jgi:hypothetical protein
MKLVIQIPAWNEEANLGETIDALPRQVEGFDAVAVLVVDDGSTDGTAEVAARHGASVVRLPVHRGLAVAFSRGLARAIELGADVIVNTDADHQYDARDLPALVRPILVGDAQMVIGDRQVQAIAHFSLTKKLLQRFGSWVVRRLSRTEVRDATSGFRAISRLAAFKLHVFTRFTYTGAILRRASRAQGRAVGFPARSGVPAVRSNRLSAFAQSIAHRRALQPARIFLRAVRVGAGQRAARPLLYFFFTNQSPAGHVQSLIVAVILIVVGVQVWVLGIVADLIAVNRRLLEEAVERQRVAGSPQPEGMTASISPGRAPDRRAVGAATVARRAGGGRAARGGGLCAAPTSPGCW